MPDEQGENPSRFTMWVAACLVLGLTAIVAQLLVAAAMGLEVELRSYAGGGGLLGALAGIWLASTSRSWGEFNYKLWPTVCVFGFVAAVLSAMVFAKQAPSPSETSQGSPQAPSATGPSASGPTFSLAPLALPIHGQQFPSQNRVPCYSSGTADVEITAPAGNALYAVKLRQESTRDGEPKYDKYALTHPVVDVLTVVIASGESTTVSVPTCASDRGYYRLVLGSGDSWYGPNHLFGPEGVYGLSEQMLFAADERWEVTLGPVVGGNLGSDPLDYGEVPSP